MNEDLSASSADKFDLVGKFLQNVRGATPLTIEQIDVTLQLIAAARDDSIHLFLDIGCGDGMLSAAILDEFPAAHGVLIDISETLLKAARHQLRSHVGRVEFIVADYTQPEWAAKIQRFAPFDAIVSAFAVHTSGERQKRQLYSEIFRLLKPEGPFLNIEQVASAIRWTESIWDDYLIEAIFGAEVKGAGGAKRVALAREHYRKAACNADIPAPLEVQCDWLREIGFEHVDCYLKVMELAVFGGQKPKE